MRRFALGAALLAVTFAHAAPPDAAKALSDARAQAQRQGKNVLVVFHASWCGWCKKFDRMLEDPKLKPTFDASYVVLHLDVMENGDKKALENPGGAEVMEGLGGKGAGLPFYAVVAPDGKKLGDSLLTPGVPTTNTGHPAETKEIAHFLDLLKASAMRMNPDARLEVEAYLKADAVKR